MDSFFSMLAVLIFVSGMAVFAFKKKDVVDLIRAARQPEISIQSVHTTIFNEIKNIKKLSLTEREFQSIATFSDDRKVFGLKVPFSERKFSVSYTGYVVCGCDLDKIQISQSFFNGSHISITVPNSTFLHVVPNLNSFQVFEQKSGLLAKNIDFELQIKEVNSDLNAVKLRMAEQGILQQSNENIRQLLTKITSPLGIVAEIYFSNNTESLPPQDVRLLR